MLAQLRVPSGFEANFGGSLGWVASALTFSQDESNGVLSAVLGGRSQLPTTTCAAGSVPGVIHGGSALEPGSALVLRGPLIEVAPAAARAPRPAPRPRSVPRPRPPRAFSKPPRPRPPRVLEVGASMEVVGGSFVLGIERSFVFFFTSPHWEMVPVKSAKLESNVTGTRYCNPREHYLPRCAPRCSPGHH